MCIKILFLKLISYIMNKKNECSFQISSHLATSLQLDSLVQIHQGDPHRHPHHRARRPHKVLQVHPDLTHLDLRDLPADLTVITMHDLHPQVPWLAPHQTVNSLKRPHVSYLRNCYCARFNSSFQLFVQYLIWQIHTSRKLTISSCSKTALFSKVVNSKKFTILIQSAWYSSNVIYNWVVLTKFHGDKWKIVTSIITNQFLTQCRLF